jgi:very-short-patch-repair endonuclease
MRHVPTDAESKLWLFLRDRRLGGWRFRRQHFIADYILDFYCAEARLAVELDGGGHAEDEKIAADGRRTAALEGRGVRLLRFWNDQALKETDTVLEIVLKALENPPHPTLSPKEERAGQAIPSPCKGEGQG